MALTTKQLRLKNLAEQAVLQESITKRVFINEMTDLIHEITLDQLKDVIRDTDSPVALKFLISAGVYGEAHTLIFAKLQRLTRPKVI